MHLSFVLGYELLRSSLVFWDQVHHIHSWKHVWHDLILVPLTQFEWWCHISLIRNKFRRWNLYQENEKLFMQFTQNWHYWREIVESYQPTLSLFILELIKRQNFHHVETSQLICRANQLIDFYMMGTLAFNELMSS